MSRKSKLSAGLNDGTAITIRSMGGTGKATLRATLIADFIERGRRAQEAVDRIIEAKQAKARRNGQSEES
jgi:hypothetical protein